MIILNQHGILTDGMKRHFLFALAFLPCGKSLGGSFKMNDTSTAKIKALNEMLSHYIERRMTGYLEVFGLQVMLAQSLREEEERNRSRLLVIADLYENMLVDIAHKTSPEVRGNNYVPEVVRTLGVEEAGE